MARLTPLTQLGELSIEEFILKYWQQKPLLIRQGLPGFTSPLSPDELAGLALEDEIESRIVLQEGKTPWELLHGPFDPQVFESLPASDWTLLIQSIDHWIPELSQLLDRFRFIPNWRLDDVMASYAVKGGSVGPHYDQYDVFLLQGSGERRWQIGQRCDSCSPRLQGTDLHILSEFDTNHEWTLQPGDLLYLPPQVAHWGVALDDDCITYSIGFRAPSKAEILEDFLQERVFALTEDDRFTDPAFRPQAESGKIDAGTLAQVKSILLEAIDDETQISNWFGRYMTRPKGQQTEILTEPTIDSPIALDDVDLNDIILRHPASRFCYTAANTAQLCELFIDGESFQASVTLCQLICNNSSFKYQQLKTAINVENDQKIVDDLFKRELLYTV